MRRALVTWSVIFGLALLGFGSAVLVLNSTLYSASGFVHGYLDSLARHDADGALALAGIETTEATVDDLLVRELMGDISEISLTSDRELDDGAHRVTFSYLIGSEKGSSEFVVERDGTFLGLFASWRFAEQPLSTISLTVLHDSRFAVDGSRYTTPEEPGRPAEYLVFAPGRYVFDHDTAYLTASEIEAAVTTIGGVTHVVVDVQANDAFVEQVQQELDEYLDERCVPQRVLLPTACPFGQPMSNRVVSEPVWAMTSYPAVTIVPGNDPGSWIMPASEGAAHLTVEVQSLFDGSITTFDEDVLFSVSYLITFLPTGELSIEARD